MAHGCAAGFSRSRHGFRTVPELRSNITNRPTTIFRPLKEIKLYYTDPGVHIPPPLMLSTTRKGWAFLDTKPSKATLRLKPSSTPPLLAFPVSFLTMMQTGRNWIPWMYWVITSSPSANLDKNNKSRRTEKKQQAGGKTGGLEDKHLKPHTSPQAR